jgi:homospermidine synthase
MQGYDKVGAMLIFKNNRGWWHGSIMDEYDSSKHFENKFGPTVLQVGGGVYSAFLWMLQNPRVGNKWAENLDTEFIIKNASPYLGRIWSNYVDLNKTHLQDCYKLESFLTQSY